MTILEKIMEYNKQMHQNHAQKQDVLSSDIIKDNIVVLDAICVWILSNDNYSYSVHILLWVFLQIF